MLFINMLMVHLVGTAHGFAITASSVAEYLKALVDKDVMNHKIGKAVGKYPEPNSKPNMEDIILPQQEEPDAYQRVKYEKSIVALKPGIVVLAVMVLMEVPQETMHDILVRKPGHKFHYGKGEEKN
jgi:hypothetical protein